MRKHIKFSTHTFARHVQRNRGIEQTCALLAHSLSRKDDGVYIYQVSGWVREQYPAGDIDAGPCEVYFVLRGPAPARRLAMAERLLAAPNRIVYIKRG
jgi:hypothetical protein